jgi:hypothetical protein
MWRSLLVDWTKLDCHTKAKVAAAVVSGDVLDKIALEESDNTVLCVQIAKNPHVMPITLSYLAKKCTLYVRELVAANEKTPIDALMALAFDEAVSVRSAVRKNPSTPVELARKMKV